MPPAENIMRLLPDAEPPAKGALVRYFEACADSCLVHLGRRPLTLVRSVDGVTFFHKGPLPPPPATVKQLTIEKGDGTPGTRLWVDDLAGLLGLVELDVVELHPWGATIDDIEHPDRLIFDLDPAAGVPWQEISAAALELRDRLQAHGLGSWPKTTGGKGLHLVVPTEPKLTWREAGGLAREIAENLAHAAPDRFTAVSGPMARSGSKIFVDWLRNGRGQTAIGAMSPRARAGGLVSMPLTWAEVERGVDPEAFTMSAVIAQQMEGGTARSPAGRAVP